METSTLHTCFLTLLVVCQFEKISAACNTAIETSIVHESVNASSESVENKASDVFTKGWCALNTNETMWLDVPFPQSAGLTGIMVSSINTSSSSYPRNVRVKYVPNDAQDDSLQDFPVTGGYVELNLTSPGSAKVTFDSGIAVKRLRFLLKSFTVSACMKIGITGCSIEELCPNICQNQGVCMYENQCKCPTGFQGTACEIPECKPATLGLSDGRIPPENITVSSEDPDYNKAELGNDDKKKGWCPSQSDHSPWVIIRLNKPMAVSVFQFNYLQQSGHNMYMRVFELQYVAPVDSTKRFITFSTDIPALNGTHYFTITTNPAVVTDTIRILPLSSQERPCFRLEMSGCDPASLCTTNWCHNGGTCMGENVCLCPKDFVGDRCEKNKTEITSTSLAFVNLSNNVIITATTTLHFHVFGNVQLNMSVVTISGQNSFIKLNNTASVASCLSDIDQCNSGFTIAIDTRFDQLLDNTYIISSGGELPNHRGIALFYTANKLTYIVSTSTQMWTLEVKYKPVLQTWQHFEITWSKYLGVELLIDGYSLGSSGQPVNKPGNETSELCIGCNRLNVTINIQIKNVNSWFYDRTILVNVGIKEEARSTSATVLTSTTAPSATTTLKTTTQLYIPTYTWNFTNIHDNVIVGTEYNLTFQGTVVIKDGGININSSSQYIEFNTTQTTCLHDPGNCSLGLTIQITMNFNELEENTYFLTSGGQLPNGVGLAIIYRYNRVQFILTTNSQSWYATCARNNVVTNSISTLTISWSVSIGLEIFINNILIDHNNIPVPNSPGVYIDTNIYIGKQPSETTRVDFVLQTITIWYAHIGILVENGICKPPIRPTTTHRPVSSTLMTTSTIPTSNSTFSIILPHTTVTNQQCPAGCISVGTATFSYPVTSAISSISGHVNSSTTSYSKTSYSATTREPMSSPTTSLTTLSSPKTSPTPPTTTKSSTPDYHQPPAIHVTIEKDNNAYLACTFPNTSQAGVQITVSLLVEGKEVLVNVVPSNVGVVMFAVAEINMFLYLKKIQCSIKASFTGSIITTQSYYSKIFVPQFQVTPNNITVVEGHSSEFVTVVSTAPPQMYCCDGCKAQCQVHIVGSFQYHRLFQKCNNTYIAQALIGSSIPPNSNRPICGNALTVINWDQSIKIEVKATIDGRKDGDHRNALEIIANVYNQPTTAQISVKPNTYNITTVQVTVKDNDSPATCSSINDPHMTTFDGRRYDNMYDGQFILYRHKYLPFEVRALYHKCSSRSTAACNCGVAVKSGDDVITITGCQGYVSGTLPGLGFIMQQMFGNANGHSNNKELAKTPMTVQIYNNGEFTPGTYIRRYGCGQKYEIELPTGLIVTVQQSYLPFINIWIVASSSDRGQAEGLCGNFDGNRSNDLLPNLNSFIAQWKVSGDNFFYGVGASSLIITSTYCSCIQGRESVCSAGRGVVQCTFSVNDITATLVRQAKLPVLSRQKRQLATDSNLHTTDIPPDSDTMFTMDEARHQCRTHILNSTVMKSCQPILTTNVSDHIENCASDYNATGSFEWAVDALRDIVVDCVREAKALIAANETGNSTTGDFPEIPHDLENILTNACVENCGKHGTCSDGVCSCLPGYSGVTCNISTATKPIVSAVPYLCDVVLTDCLAATVLGDSFVQSPSLKCYYEFIEILDGITRTGSKGSVLAVYISINQVMCLLPRLQNARITVSNDGHTESDLASVHVLFNSNCQECSLRNDTDFTPVCITKENSCIIDQVCYDKGQTKPGDTCKLCQPSANFTVWSNSNEPGCSVTHLTQAQSEDSDKTSVIALAVVCGVLAAVIIVGMVCLISIRAKRSKKIEFGEYDVRAYDNLYRDTINSACPEKH